MRSIWKGSISFGLVNVPVKLFSATQDHDVDLHQVHDADGGRIRYQRRCEACGKVVEYADIDRAAEVDDSVVVLRDEDFEALPSESTDEISVLQFVPEDQLDPIMLEKPYYLAPTSKTPKSYLLLRQTLQDAEQLAVVKVTLRSRTRLAVLRVHGKILMVQTLRWADEIREADFEGVGSRAKISAQELDMAAKLVEAYSGDFEPEQYEDDYQAELQKLIDLKVKRGETVDPAEAFPQEADGDDEERDGEGKVIDLMAALEKSVAATRSRRTKGSSGRKTKGA
jgi:DNA end-binding protein Ku